MNSLLHLWDMATMQLLANYLCAKENRKKNAVGMYCGSKDDLPDTERKVVMCLPWCNVLLVGIEEEAVLRETTS